MAHDDRLGRARTNTALREILERLRDETPEGRVHLQRANTEVLARHLSNLRSQKEKIGAATGNAQIDTNESLRRLLSRLERIVADSDE
jgi:hypothetical protein